MMGGELPSSPKEDGTCLSVAFEARAADAASYLPGAAAACCCPMLSLFGNQT